MIRNDFATKQDAELYLKTEKILIERKQSNLSFSEREKVKNNTIRPELLVAAKKDEKTLPLIKDITKLKVPCQEVVKGENVSSIIKLLKDTLAYYPGIGLTANQIGYNKRISYLKVPVYSQKGITYAEYVMINARIIERERPIRVNGEGCLSFPGIKVDTQRFVFITVEYLDEKMQLQTRTLQDLEAIAVQHELGHQNGKTIFDVKWRAK